ncbi:hypothetical protein MKW98_014955, partial [Papaver atlanticum]
SSIEAKQEIKINCFNLRVWFKLKTLLDLLYNGGVEGFEATAAAEDTDERIDTASEFVSCYSHHLVKKHDIYKHLINGFSVHTTPEQTESLRQAPGVKSVERDWKVKRLTVHTPQFLFRWVWPTGGGCDRAGEDIVIGFVDSGIYPHHPSFATHNTVPYGPLPKYRGKCEIDPDTKRDFCNGKIICAQYFSAAAVASGSFNLSVNHAYPLDGDGHGSHTAAIAAGNNGISLQMHGFEFGRASGMAPRARIAVYKALYRYFGGFGSDVVAAIDQLPHFQIEHSP